ncbi:hypothetical protein J7399_13215 [Shimia sp. R9_1]|uniref:CARDB domain-containing protein n=1 Tax=Shimia sp. R9_1 TaxID=2821111 RepID=UPI001ADA2BEB|nr:CARDB domain-containing protein [Shimia sp. R9_1]MBO9408392.1 hypothetical protein [Shimia sp. R9_1]
MVADLRFFHEHKNPNQYGFDGDGVRNGKYEAEIKFYAGNYAGSGVTDGHAATGARYNITAYAPNGTELGEVASGALTRMAYGDLGSYSAKLDHSAIYRDYPELIGQRLTYKVKLDSEEQIDELNEGNNIATFTGDPLPEVGVDLKFFHEHKNSSQYGFENEGVRNGTYESEIVFYAGNGGNDSPSTGARYNITAFAPDGTELGEVASGALTRIAYGDLGRYSAKLDHSTIYRDHPELIGQRLTYEVKLDSEEQIDELNEGNNIATFTGDPLPALPIDLEISHVSIEEMGVLDGALNVSLTFEYSIEDLLLYHGEVNYKVEMIAPGQSSGTVISSGQIEAPLGDSSGTISIPDAAAAIYNGGGALDETYRFRVTIDPENTIDETNENNNTGETSLFAPLIKPDAYVTEVDAEGDDTFVFKASLGGNDILSAPVEYQIVASAEKGGPILVLDSGDTTLFAGGDMQVIRLNDVDDALAAAGGNPATDKYILTAILDQNAKLDEFNEFNNFGSEVFDFV